MRIAHPILDLLLDAKIFNIVCIPKINENVCKCALWIANVVAWCSLQDLFDDLLDSSTMDALGFLWKLWPLYSKHIQCLVLNHHCKHETSIRLLVSEVFLNFIIISHCIQLHICIKWGAHLMSISKTISDNNMQNVSSLVYCDGPCQSISMNV